VQIGVIGLKENNQEERFNIPVGHSGIYNQPISYFIPATNFDSEVSFPIKVNLYIDGMLYRTESKELTGVHKRAFRVSISGVVNQTKRFNGEKLLYFKVPVTVPMESEKTFSFTVTVKEDGCPSYTKNIKRTIKHYDLQ
jgi:hypothetical protein